MYEGKQNTSNFFTKDSFQNTFIFSGLFGALIIIGVVIIACCIAKNKKKKRKNDVPREDLNDLYGTYYNGPGKPPKIVKSSKNRPKMAIFGHFFQF